MEIHILESLCGVAAVGQEWTGELMKKNGYIPLEVSGRKQVFRTS